MPHPDRAGPENSLSEIGLERDLLAERLAEISGLLRLEYEAGRKTRVEYRAAKQFLREIFESLERETRDEKEPHDSHTAPQKHQQSSIRVGGRTRMLHLRRTPKKFFVPKSPEITEVWIRAFCATAGAKVVVEMRIRAEPGSSTITELAGEPRDTGEPDSQTRRIRLPVGLPIRLFAISGGEKILRFTLHCVHAPSCRFQLARRTGPDITGVPPKSMAARVTPIAGSILRDALELAQTGRMVDAIAFAEAHADEVERPAIHLLRANQSIDDEALWLSHLNRYVDRFGLTPIELTPEGPSRFLRLTAPVPRSIEQGPLVSVVMCAYNAEQTLPYAAESILRQTWRPLELIIVDDASTDGTVSIARELMRRDPRVKLHRNGVNVGCDVTKSIGASLATGQYLTSHDADDWAHPERIERHLGAMLADRDTIKVSRAFVLRVSHEGMFGRFVLRKSEFEDGAMRPAMITCLFETAFFRERLGSWDSVRYGADSEMYYRVKRVFGDQIASYPQLSMLMLDVETSETHHSIYGHRTPIGTTPQRREYRSSYQTWHEQLTPSDARLSLPHPRAARRFPAPATFSLLDHRIEAALAGLPDNGNGGDYTDTGSELAEASIRRLGAGNSEDRSEVVRDRDFLAARVKQSENQLGDLYKHRGAQSATQRETERLAYDLFERFVTLVLRRQKAQPGEFRLCVPEKPEPPSSKKSKARSDRSRDDQPANKARSRALSRRQRRSDRKLFGTFSSTLRLPRTPLCIVIPAADREHEVWARSLCRDRDAKSSVELRLCEPHMPDAVSDLAGEAMADATGESDQRTRKLRLSAGHPILLFSTAASEQEVKFSLRRVYGEPCLVELTLKRKSKGSFDRSWWAPPEKGKTLARARDFADHTDTAEAVVFAETYAGKSERPGLNLLRANRDIDDEELWLAHVNRYVAPFGITPIQLMPEGPTRFLRITADVPRRIETGPLVSVVMCAYNAEQTLSFAAESILRQTWRPLELIIVDDASTDGTVAIARELIRRDPRVRLHRTGVNVGCDVTKSIGARRATGQYITSHDADDWAHPERIERHLGAMLAAGDAVKVSRTSMLRVTHAGEFRRFMSSLHLSPDGALRPAMISCLFETRFFRERLGSWDSVRFGADTEMFYRAKSILGEGCVHFQQLAMLMLDTDTSLSYNADYGSNSSAPVFRDYRAMFEAWHRNLHIDKAYVPLPHSHEQRLFPAPGQIMVPDFHIERALRGAPDSDDEPVEA